MRSSPRLCVFPTPPVPPPRPRTCSLSQKGPAAGALSPFPPPHPPPSPFHPTSMSRASVPLPPPISVMSTGSVLPSCAWGRGKGFKHGRRKQAGGRRGSRPGGGKAAKPCLAGQQPQTAFRPPPHGTPPTPPTRPRLCLRCSNRWRARMWPYQGEKSSAGVRKDTWPPRVQCSAWAQGGWARSGGHPRDVKSISLCRIPQSSAPSSPARDAHTHRTPLPTPTCSCWYLSFTTRRHSSAQ